MKFAGWVLLFRFRLTQYGDGVGVRALNSGNFNHAPIGFGFNQDFAILNGDDLAGKRERRIVGAGELNSLPYFQIFFRHGTTLRM